MKKVYIAIVLFILAFAVPVTVYSVITGQFDLRNRAAEEDSDNTSAPQIVSVPITEAFVGNEYNYIVKAVDSDIIDVDALDYMVDQKPNWLEWNEERNMFTGTPSSSDIGSDNVVLNVSDGKWMTTQSFTITVESSSQSDSDTSTNSGQDESDQLQEDQESDDETIQEEQSAQPEVVFEPVAETATPSESTGLVLGETDELPQTSSMGLLIGISLGFAVLVLAIYFWLDSKYQFTERISKRLEYMIGRQTTFKLDDGLEVRRRKERL